MWTDVIAGERFYNSSIVVKCDKIILDIGCKNSHVEITTKETDVHEGLFNLDSFDYIMINGRKFVRERESDEQR